MSPSGEGGAATHTPGLLPKIELHLHLDCSLSFEVVRHLDPGVSLATYRRDFVAPEKCLHLADFLTRPPRQVALMQTEEGLRAAVLDLFAQLQQDGVIYAELRFAPLLHLQSGLRPERVVRVVDEAAADGVQQTGIEVRIILCALRHFKREESLATAELVIGCAGDSQSRVAALDLAGDEAGFPLEPHVDAFELAARHGIARTAHAGEALGAESVRETLAALRPSRIGHGIRAVEDQQVVAMLRRQSIHLEVCPTSNVQTNVCRALSDHPIDRLVKAGVSLGISTDTRTVTSTTLRAEYAHLQETFGWTVPDFRQRNFDALAAAFAPEDLKRRLARELGSE